jgi:hypothetical protein
MVELLAARDQIESAIHAYVKPVLDLVQEIKFPNGELFLDEIHSQGEDVLLFFHVTDGRAYCPSDTVLAIPARFIDAGDLAAMREYIADLSLPTTID